MFLHEGFTEFGKYSIEHFCCMSPIEPPEVPLLYPAMLISPRPYGTCSGCMIFFINSKYRQPLATVPRTVSPRYVLCTAPHLDKNIKSSTYECTACLQLMQYYITPNSRKTRSKRTSVSCATRWVSTKSLPTWAISLRTL